MSEKQKITPCLWFNFNADKAVAFYSAIFPDFRETARTHYGPDHPYAKEDEVLTISFELFGQEFTALNGGPQFPFTNAVSFTIKCDDQKEVDYYWDKLMQGGGKPQQCGWLNDQFGVPWQVTPTVLLEMITDKDPAKVNRVMNVMMQMVKLEIKPLQDAYNGA